MPRNVIELIITAKDITGKAFRQINKSLFSMQSAVAGIGLGALARDIYKTNADVQSLNRSFVAIQGSVEQANVEFDYLRTLANQLGQNFYVLTEGYKGISAAAKEAKISNTLLHNIFTSLTEASAALGLSSEDLKLSLLAVEQMMSKGTVSAEELRRQLGERLPGAFAMAAQATGVTAGEFDKLLRQGKVMSADLLPKLAQALHEKYGQAAVKASSDARAAVNKFQETWTDLKITIGEAGFVEAAADAIRSVTKEIKEWTKENKDFLKVKVPEYIDKVKGFVIDLGSAWNSLPSIVKEIGIIGAIIGGAKARIAIALITSAIVQIQKMNRLAGEAADNEIAKTNTLIKQQESLINRLEARRDEVKTNAYWYGKYSEQIENAKQKLADLHSHLEQNKVSWLDHSKALNEAEKNLIGVNEASKGIKLFTDEQIDSATKNIKKIPKEVQDAIGEIQDLYSAYYLTEEGRLLEWYTKQRELLKGHEDELTQLYQVYTARRNEIDNERNQVLRKQAKEREEQERSNLDELQNLHDEYFKSDKQLLESWYAEQRKLFANNKEALLQLEEVYQIRLQELREGTKENIMQGLGIDEDTQAQFLETWENYFGTLQGVFTQIQELSRATWNTFKQGVGDAVASAIIYGESLSEAMSNVLKQIAASVISTLIQIGIERLAQLLIALMLNVKETAAKMASIAAVTYGHAFAASASTGPIGLVAAPGVAAAAVATMLAGSKASAAIGAAAGTEIGGISGIAHGGLENPDEGTYLIKRGERLLSPRQNKDLTDFMSNKSNTNTTIIKELNVMPNSSIDEALFDKPLDWWIMQVKKNILPALNELGRDGITTTLAYRSGRV